MANKKIVVLTGSPRKNGNSAALAEAFIQAAEKKGHEVSRFDAALASVEGCRACDTCYKSGQACSFDDDFNKIAPALEAADAVVFATPLYWYTFPAQLKAVIDKLYAFMTGERGLGHKECALVACCADDVMSAYDGMVNSYRQTVGLLKWKSVGELLLTSVAAPGDVEKTDGPARVEALAAGLFA